MNLRCGRRRAARLYSSYRDRSSPVENARTGYSDVLRDVKGILSVIMCLIGFSVVRFVERSEREEREEEEEG